MQTMFSHTLSLLRQELGVSQRQAAQELGISQALLSHYENGVREPGLAFVGRACDYYQVTADFLLGRTQDRDGAGLGLVCGRLEVPHIAQVFCGAWEQLCREEPKLLPVAQQLSATLRETLERCEAELTGGEQPHGGTKT